MQRPYPRSTNGACCCCRPWRQRSVCARRGAGRNGHQHQDFAPGRIACTHGEGTQHLATDAALLRIALRNLLANADRHASADAAVQVETRLHGARLRIQGSHPVAAIPPEEQPHLFMRYWRGSGAQHRPGAGLGLYLVRRIAEKLGGGVALASAGGPAPVCFQLELPAPPRAVPKA